MMRHQQRALERKPKDADEDRLTIDGEFEDVTDRKKIGT